MYLIINAKNGAYYVSWKHFTCLKAVQNTSVFENKVDLNLFQSIREVVWQQLAQYFPSSKKTFKIDVLLKKKECDNFSVLALALK